MNKTIILRPRVSEKAYALSQSDNVYVFAVRKHLSKQTIAGAVQAQFGVTVEAIRTTVIKGKAKRTVRKGGRPVDGRNSDFKKAYVTLKEGDSIPVFASQEEQAKEDKPAKAKKEKK